MRTLYFQTKTDKQYGLELTDGVITQFHFQTASTMQVGDLVSGKIHDIDPRLQAAFISIGNETAYLPLKKENHYVKGMKMILTVTKNATGQKRMTVSDQVEWPSEHLVYFPYENTVKISSKIPTEQAREINDWLTSELEGNEGVLVRTKAQDLSKHELLDSFDQLKREWKSIEQLAEKKQGLLKRSSNRLKVLLQDQPESFDRIVCDDVGFADELRNQYPTAPVQFDAHFYTHRPFTLKELSEKLTERRVKLKSGAELVIDRTEALTVIDVNSARSSSHQRKGELYLRVNQEAAQRAIDEIAIRKISGIILIDFINLKDKQHQEQIVNILRNQIKATKLQAQVVGFTKLGLMELTVKREAESVYDFFSHEIPETQSNHLFMNSQLEDALLMFQTERVEIIETVVQPTVYLDVSQQLKKLHKKHGFTFSLYIRQDSTLQNPFQLYKIGDADWLTEKRQAEGKSVDKLF